MNLQEIAQKQTSRMLSHMQFATYHTSTYRGTLNCPGLSIHEKDFIIFQQTPKTKKGTYGTPRTECWLVEQPGRHFKSLEDLIRECCKEEIDKIQTIET